MCLQDDRKGSPRNVTIKHLVREIVLWVIALLLALVCVRSGFLKFSGNVFWVRDFHRWGYPDWFRVVVGLIEIASAALLLIPRFASYGGIMFGVIMLGAIATHYQHNETGRLPFNVLLLTLSVIVALMRRPHVMRALPKLNVN